MRRLGTHQVPWQSKAPALVLIAYDVATRTPKFSMSQESDSDIPIVKVNGVKLINYGVLNDVTITGTRPQSGGAIVRQTMSVTFNTDNERGYPLNKDPFKNQLFFCGENFNDLYFMAYSFDRTNLYEDVTLGACYGGYKIDNSLEWSEKDGMLSMNLIDLLLPNLQVVGATEEAIPFYFFTYNPWYNGNIMPKVYGQVPRIKMLNAFPSFSIKDLASTVTGQIKANYGTSDAFIVLETNVDQEGFLFQISLLAGNVVRVKMHDGEVISGTITYDSLDNELHLTVTDRNTYYNSVQGYMDALDGKSPNQWPPSHIGGLPAPPSYSTVAPYSISQTIIPNAKNLILDPNGYMQADINVYDGAAPSKNKVVTGASTKMNGLLSNRKDVVQHDPWIDPTATNVSQQTTISTFFNNASNSSNFPPGTIINWAYELFEWMKFYDTSRTIKLYFNDPATSTPGTGSVGDSWNMLSVQASSVDYSAYIRNGFSRFDIDHIYCEGEGRLIKIPSGNIVSITQSGTFYGMGNLAKITLTAAPLDMNIGAKSNIIYVDALYKTGDFESRTERIIYEILKEYDLLYNLAGNTLSAKTIDYPTLNFLPYIGVLLDSDKTLSDLLDEIVYQIGCTFRWDMGLFELRMNAYYFNTWSEVEEEETPPDDEPIQKYILINIPMTDKTEMHENTGRVSIGQVQTHKFGDGKEYITLYSDSSYGGWQDPFFKETRSAINRYRYPYERLVSYKYNYINDKASNDYAKTLAASIGHASGYTLIQRRLICEMTMDAVRWEAMDPILFKDFPLITNADNNDIPYDPNLVIVDGPIVDNGVDAPYIAGADKLFPLLRFYDLSLLGKILYRTQTGGHYYLMGGLCVVDQVSYVFNQRRPHVEMIARVSQLKAEVRGTGGGGPPGPPPGPGSGNGTDPPGVPGTPGGTNSYGGNDAPMPPIYTSGEIVIDSGADKSVTITLTADDSFVWALGWSWIAEPIDGDHLPMPISPGIVSISPIAGGFPDKSGIPITPYTLTITANYHWFGRQSLGTTERDLKFLVTRTYHVNRDPTSDYAQDTFTLKVKVRRVEPIGITGT